MTNVVIARHPLSILKQDGTSFRAQLSLQVAGSLEEQAKHHAKAVYNQLKRPVVVEYSMVYVKGDRTAPLTQFLEWHTNDTVRLKPIFTSASFANFFHDICSVTMFTYIDHCEMKHSTLYEYDGNLCSARLQAGVKVIELIGDPTQTFNPVCSFQAKDRSELEQAMASFISEHQYKRSTKTYEEAKVKLREDIHNGQIVLFVGAGVSCNLNLPTFKGLLQQMEHHFGFHHHSLLEQQAGDFLQLSQYIKDRYSEQEYQKFFVELKSEWDAKCAPQKIKDVGVHEKLIRLGIPTIYTTNYDAALERAHSVYQKPYRVVRRLSEIYNQNDNEVEIIKYNGDFEAFDDIVLTENSALDRLDFQHPLDIKLRSDTLTKGILFIGYSMDDIAMRLLIRKMNRLWEKHRSDKRPPIYVFLTTPNEVREEIFLKQHIQPIVGDFVLNETKTGIDHRQTLVQFLDDIAW